MDRFEKSDPFRRCTISFGKCENVLRRNRYTYVYVFCCISLLNKVERRGTHRK